MLSLRRGASALAVCMAGMLALPASGAKQADLFVPVLRENFPDPFVLQVGKHFLGYSTTSGGRNVPMAASTDLVTWRMVKDEKNPKRLYDAMPTLPTWAKPGFTWAPEVLSTDRGYVLYFSAPHRKLDVQCIGVATSADSLGPFLNAATEPLVCQPALGGTIDAHPFRDTDGKLYLYYKNDGNNPRFLKPSQIWAQRLSADGLRMEGQATAILKNDTHWEWRVVEAPARVRHAGGYTMFFSGNHFGWEADQRLSNYGTGYATCTGPIGPCVDASENPWLRSYNGAPGCLSGPGHPTVFKAGSRSFIAFLVKRVTDRSVQTRNAVGELPLDYSARHGLELLHVLGSPIVGDACRDRAVFSRVADWKPSGRQQLRTLAVRPLG